MATIGPGASRAELASPLERLVGHLRKDPAVLGIILNAQGSAGAPGEAAQVLVLVSGDWWKREAVHLDGATFEIQFQPLEWCQSRIKKDKDGGLIHLLYHGKILSEQKGVASKLQQTAIDVYLEGPPALAHKAREGVRLELTQRHLEVQEALRRDPLGAQMLMHEVLRLAIEGHFRLKRWWVTPSKFLLAELKRRDPPLYGSCRNFLGAGTAPEKYQWLAKILAQVLRPVGGFLRDIRRAERFSRRRRLDILLGPFRLIRAALAYLRDGHAYGAGRFAHILRFALFLSPYKAYFLVLTLCGLLVTALTLPLPFLTKVVVDDVLPHRNFPLLKVLLLLGLGLALLRHLVSLGQDYYATYIGQLIKYDVEFKFYRRLFTFPQQFYDEAEIGQIVYRFSDAAAAVAIVSDIILKLANYSALFLLAPVAILILDWRLALISCAVIPFYALSYYALSRCIYTYTRSVTFASAAYTAKNYASLRAMRLVQALAADHYLLRRLRRAYLEMRREIVSLSLVRFSFQHLNGAIAALGTFAVAWYAWHQILAGRLTMGDLVAYALLIGLLLRPITGLLSLGQDIQRGIVRAGRFFAMYDAQPTNGDGPGAGRAPGVLQGGVEFRQVSAEYVFGKEVLQGISFTVMPGSTLALVGPSGAGKSTLVSLLLGLYEPAGGEILFDGVDMRRLDLRWLRGQIGFVPEQDFLFEGTIADNIRLGRPWATDREVEEATRLCLLHPRIVSLPDGYETKLGEGGAQLSEGERRQLSMARALLRRPRILILDEVLSHLDPRTEETIVAALQQLNPRPTIFLVASRAASIRRCDAVLYLAEGTMRGLGPHGALAASNREYAEFVERL